MPYLCCQINFPAEIVTLWVEWGAQSIYTEQCVSNVMSELDNFDSEKSTANILRL